MTDSIALRLPPLAAGQRLDRALAALLPDYSRGRIQQWLDDGHILIDGHRRRRSDKVVGGERVTVQPVPAPNAQAYRPRSLMLTIVFEDEHLIVLDKPAGLVVHPAAGHWDDTLLNALLHHRPALADLPRCGIVHRLDKDTSGLLVVAKTARAQQALIEQLRARSMRREYRALVVGVVAGGARIEAPLGRHPRQRTRMAVVAGGRPAVTEFRVLQRYRRHSLLAVRLETGRTHQIRVHLAYRGYPLVGDPLYGGRPQPPPGATAAAAAVQRFPRQALHATALGLIHPLSGAPLRWEIPLAPDFAALLEQLDAETPADAPAPAGGSRATHDPTILDGDPP